MTETKDERKMLDFSQCKSITEKMTAFGTQIREKKGSINIKQINLIRTDF